MPQLLAPVLVATFGISANAAIVAANVIILVASYAANAALSSAQQRAAKKAARRQQSQNDYQQTIRGSIQPRVRHYGRVKAGGTITFIENIGSDVYMVVATGTGTIAGFDEFYVGDRQVLLDADGAVTNAPYYKGASSDPNARSYIRLQSRRGYATQDAFTLLTAAFPGKYTAEHRLNGISCIAARYAAASQNDFAKIYNSSIPDIKTVTRAALVYDPRKPAHDWNDPNTWEYSTNPALIALDYLVNQDGMRVSKLAPRLPYFITAANICDELVPLKTGGSERRYTCSGSYTFDEAPRDVLRKITDTCRGEFFLTRDGGIGFRVARWEEPDVTLGPDDIVSINYKRGIGLLRQFNAVKPIFTSAAHGYQEIEAALVQDDDAVAEIGRRVTDEARLPWVPSHSQAQRLAKIELYEDNPELLGELTCHFTRERVSLFGKRVFRLDLPEFEIDTVCRITALKFDQDLAVMTIGFEEIAPEAHAWDPTTDEGDAPAVPPATNDDPLNPAPPDGLATTTKTVSSVTKTGVRWNAVDRTGQTFTFRHRETGVPDWTTVTGLTEKGYVLDPVTLATSYDVEVRAHTTQGGISGWAALTFTAANHGSVSLAAPSAAAATGGQGTVEIRATQSATADAWAIQYSIYPAAGSPDWSSPPSALRAPGAAFVKSVSLAAGSYLVKFRAVTVGGAVVSAETSAVAFTVAEVPPTGGGGGGSGGDGPGGGGTGNTGGYQGPGPDGGTGPGGIY